MSTGKDMGSTIDVGAPGVVDSSETPHVEPTEKGQEHDIRLLKQEVDALQVSLMKQSKPWYKSASTIISVVALIFSFGTTYVSQQRAEAQDTLGQRAELRDMLQRLAALPKENQQILLEHSGDPGAIASLTGYLNQENSILVSQAADLAKALPPEKVSATELYAIGLAANVSYDARSAIDFFEQAAAKADDFNDEIAILRSHADVLFAMGDHEGGRAKYREALRIFDDYPGYNQFVKTSTHIWTELSWAMSEANAGSQEVALRHVSNAEEHLSSLPLGPGTFQLEAQVSHARRLLVPEPVPAPQTMTPVEPFRSRLGLTPVTGQQVGG